LLPAPRAQFRAGVFRCRKVDALKPSGNRIRARTASAGRHAIANSISASAAGTVILPISPAKL